MSKDTQEPRNWQDVMIEHKIDKDWIKEAGAYDNEKAFAFCSRLTKTILKLEKDVIKRSSKLSMSISDYNSLQRVRDLNNFLVKENKSLEKDKKYHRELLDNAEEMLGTLKAEIKRLNKELDA